MATKAFDENGYYVEVYSKQELDSNGLKIYVGDEEPTDSLGKQGDIYIKVNLPIVGTAG